MQNLGFAFAMIPVLKSIYLANQDRNQALLRHIEFFNTHPYCAAIVLGVVIQMEEAGAINRSLDEEQISRIKTGMMGPLAALGDTVFWASLKPVLSLVAVALILTAQPDMDRQLLAGLLAFLVLYNLPHLLLRIGGVFIGYRRGINVVQDLRKFNPQIIAKKLTLFLAIVAGGIIVLYPVQQSDQLWLDVVAKSLLFVSVTVVLVFAIRRQITIAKLIYGLIGLAMLIALIIPGF